MPDSRPAPVSNALPLIGLIVPPAHGQVPTDGPALYADRARFMARGLALGEISPSGYEAVIGQVADRAKELAQAGAKAVSLMGTSISFYRGAQFNRELEAAIHDATGLPATTMSNAVVRGLRTTGVKKVALATAYIDEVNRRLVAFLEEEGFEITAIKGLDIKDVTKVAEVPAEDLMRLSEEVFVEDTSADGLLVSCGGLLTLDILAPLEKRLGVPVVSSSPAGFWDAVQMAGVDPRVAGYGQLFARGRA